MVIYLAWINQRRRPRSGSYHELATAKESSMDVLSELDGIFPFKTEERTALRFTTCFCSSSDWLLATRLDYLNIKTEASPTTSVRVEVCG